MLKIEKNNIRNWIENLPKEGKITFTFEEIAKTFSSIKINTIRRSLTRFVKGGKIQSVHNGFYVIIPIEYALKGEVPPVFYINQLMEFLKRKYYVGLLDAAAFFGAAHQRAQIFTVITTLPVLRNSIKKGVAINYLIKRNFPENLFRDIKTKAGYVKVSSPELTAIDLIIYQSEVGGLNRVCTVLDELCEKLNFEEIPEHFLKTIPISAIQRLGYLLDKELEQKELAEKLLEKVKSENILFRKTVLKISKTTKGCAFDKKWKIIINEKIEID